MVDIHCHILPQMDDGAAVWNESVEMARIAWKTGVTQIAATPHFPGTEEAASLLPQILRRVQTLQEELNRQRIPVTVYPGAEVLCLPQTADLARKDLLPTMGMGRYVLTEFYFDTPGEEMERLLHPLFARGYLPVIAHPERYEAVQKDPSLALRWFDREWGIQLNKGSVFGAFGAEAERTALWLLRHGAVHMIASDAHHAKTRTTDFSRIAAWAEKNLGAAYTDVLLRRNPQRVIRGLPLVGNEL